ncbi:MAG: polysaccharide deacetylase family protein [Dehalococcoidia bacterium]
MTSVLVVIACYTEDRWTATCLATDSALAQTVPVEVAVVVDHNPRLLERLCNRYGEKVRIVANRFAQGAGGARNTAALVTNAEYVAFLDDDAIAAPDWIAHMLRALENDKAAVGAGGAIRPLWQGQRPQWFPEEFLWVVGATFRGQPQQTSPVRNVWSGSMLVRTQPFVEAGGFREGFGKVGDAAQPEDTEVCIRITEASGGHWLYVPDALIEHLVPESRATMSYFIRRCRAEGAGKALLAALAPSGMKTLGEESAFVRKIALAGFIRNLAAVPTSLSAASRALAVVIGLAAAMFGFAWATGTTRARRGRPIPSHGPASSAMTVSGAKVRTNDAERRPAEGSGSAALPVLMYHAVPRTEADAAGDPLAVTAARLREQLEALREDGWRLLGLTDALDALSADPAAKIAALTFDDGLLDFLNAADVLDELGAGATLYVPSGLVAADEVPVDRRKMLNWAELSELAARGFEIGSHSRNHRALDVRNSSELMEEVVASRSEIQNRIGIAVRSFCYPYGYHNRRVRRAVRDAGYTNACVIGRRVASLGEDRFSISRVQLWQHTTGVDVLRLVAHGEPGIAPVVKRIAYPAWRIVRLGSTRLLHRELT